jgi:DNA helicase-2/ATP-dependent DNA helicase PcrA
VCDAVLAHREEGIELREQAVLFRTGHHSDLLEIELGRRNIPFVKYGGLKFLEAAHVKDLMALLRIADNPYDEPAWFRTLTMLEGVGPANARRVMAAVGVRPRAEGDGPSPILRLAEAAEDAPPLLHDELAGLAAALGDCAVEPAPPPSTQVERLAEFLTPIVARRYDSPDVRLGDLEALAAAAAGFASRSRFITELVLDPAAHTGDLAQPPHLDDDFLTLSTVHSAKGGEWRAVHVIQAADGMFPSDMATRDADGVDEERRLFYVALTRAIDHLHVYFPMRYYHYRERRDDLHGYAPITRFLPPATQALFDQRQVGVVATEDNAPRPGLVTAAAAKVDAGISALLGG